MYAVDGGGNVSEAVSREFDVDKAKPAVSATAPEYVNYETNSDHSRKVTIRGRVSESHGLASFTVSRDGGSASPVTGITLNEGVENVEWSYEDETLTEDRTYTYTITATDLVGKSESLTKTVKVDVTLPEVSEEEAKFSVPGASQNSIFKEKQAVYMIPEAGLIR